MALLELFVSLFISPRTSHLMVEDYSHAVREKEVRRKKKKKAQKKNTPP